MDQTFWFALLDVQLEEIFDGEVVIFLREQTGQLSCRFGEQSVICPEP